jgi:chromosome segregation ATPase
MLDKLQINTKQKLNEVKKEIKDIEDKLLQLSNPNLIKKLEQRWAELEQERLQLETQLDNKILLETHWKELYKKAEFLFTNPAGLYEAGDYQIKKVLVKIFA